MLAKASRALDQVVSPVSSVISRIGAILIILMMLTIALDVFLRFCNLPVLSTMSFEIVELLLATVFFTFLAYAGITKRHIIIDSLINKIPPKAQAIVRVTALVVSIGLLSIATWQMVVRGSFLLREGETCFVLPMPVFPFLYIGAFCLALLALVLLRDLLEFLQVTLDKSKGWLAALLVVVPVLTVLVVWLILRQPAALDVRTAGYIGIAAMTLLLFSGMYLGLVILLIGFLGMSYVSGVSDGLALLKHVPFTVASTYSFSVIPLFILMGEFAFYGGLTRDLYYAAHRWFGRLPGGLAMTTIAACAGFSACSGSSIATAAMMGEVALPEMKKFNYDPKLATGSVAAGGTLGILIPPSTMFVIYGILTQTSIGKLFIAGIFPGILLASLFMLSIYIRVRRNTRLGPPGPSSSLWDKLSSLKNAWSVIVLFILVIGGIYAGIFTPTEAAGVGAFAALVFALARRRLNKRDFVKAITDCGNITAMLFLVIIAANVFGYFMAVSRIPSELAEALARLSIPVTAILVSILFVFFVFGCIGEVVTMMIIIVPILLPGLKALGIDLIHFGVLMVMIIETGAISPPVGMNVFVIKGIAKDVTLSDMYRGVIPFILVQIICIGLVLAFPQIAVFLSSFLK